MIKPARTPIAGVKMDHAAHPYELKDEVRQFFRVRTTMKQQVSLAQQREVFRQRLDALKAMMLGA